METEYEITFKFQNPKKFQGFLKFLDGYLEKPDNRGKHTKEIHRQTREFLALDAHRGIPYIEAYKIMASQYKED